MTQIEFRSSITSPLDGSQLSALDATSVGHGVNGSASSTPSVTVSRNADGGLDISIYISFDSEVSLDSQAALDELKKAQRILDLTLAFFNNPDINGTAAAIDKFLTDLLAADMEGVPPALLGRFKDLFDLLAQLANNMRSVAITQITQAVGQIVNELSKAAQELRNAAEHNKSGALNNLIVSVVVATVSAIVAVAGAIKFSPKAQNAPKQVDGQQPQVSPEGTKASSKADVTPNNALAAPASPEATNNLVIAKLWSATIEAFTSFGASLANYVEKEETAEAQKDEADGQIHQAAAETTRGFKDILLKNLDDLKRQVDSLIAALKEMEDNEANTEGNLVRNMSA